MSTVESRMSDALETIEALAEQNRLLRDALKMAEGIVGDYGIICDGFQRELQIINVALTQPNLSTSILNQRDARVLREAATRFTEEQHPGIWHKLKEMAAEKEKPNEQS